MDKQLRGGRGGETSAEAASPSIAIRNMLSAWPWDPLKLQGSIFGEGIVTSMTLGAPGLSTSFFALWVCLTCKQQGRLELPQIPFLVPSPKQQRLGGSVQRSLALLVGDSHELLLAPQ